MGHSLIHSIIHSLTPFLKVSALGTPGNQICSALGAPSLEGWAESCGTWVEAGARARFALERSPSCREGKGSGPTGEGREAVQGWG